MQSCTFVPMHQFTNDDIAVGLIEGGSLDNQTVIASIYLEDTTNKQIKKPTILPLMEELVNFCTIKQMRLIMGLDANAHSPLWGCNDTNKRGEELEEFIFDKGLYVHNLGNEPTWQNLTKGISSIPDVTLSLNLGDDLQDWHVSTKETFSDHNMIRFVLGSTQNQKIWTRNYSKAKWQKFSDHITSNLKEPPHLWSETIAEESLDYLYKTIDKGLDLACPKHRAKKRDTLIWWNQECENARKHYISMKYKMKRMRTLTPNLNTVQILQELVEKTNKAHKTLKYLIRKTKRDSFRELVRETDTISEMSRLDKILDRKEASILGLVKRADGSSTTTSGESLQVMFNEHFPGNEPLTDLDIRSSMEGDPRPIETLDWVTNFKIRQAIMQFKPHKAAGPDDIRPIVLQHLPEVAITYLCSLYTACLQMGFTPSGWCHSKVIFMPKPGKKSYKEPRSFRPLSLVAFLCKALQRLVVWRVEETALLERPLHPKQFAFRKNKSTDMALSGALNTIESALYRKNMVIVIDLDIKGAFDNISTNAIVRAMEERKIEHIVCSWYSDYLHHRTCESSLGGSTVQTKLTRGCPQGDVASPPIAWNIPYDSFLEAYDGSSVAQFGFADDSKLIIIGIDFDMMLRLAQWAISEAERWAASTGVSYSPEKTAVMFLNKGVYKKEVGKARKRPELFQPPVGTHLMLYNKPVEWTTESNYLGIIFDHKLSFKKHIETKIASAKRKLMILSNVFRNTWGPNPKASRWAYTGIVRPALSYGSVVWANKAQSQYMKEKLKKLQRLALLSIAPVRKSTPTAALELLYDVKPLHLFVKEHALKTLVRIGTTSPNWTPTGTRGHQHILMDSFQKIVKNCKIDNLTKTVVWEQNYEVIIGDGNDIPIKRDWTCYTDGSKKGTKTGSGGIILHKSQEFKKLSYSVGGAEVFQAEISAILTATEILLAENIIGKQIDILSDSQAGLKALSNPITISDLVRKTKGTLNKLGAKNELILHYIQAHKGWEYNEIADKEAKAGADKLALPENVPALSKCSVFTDIELIIKKEWEQSWHNDPTCRQTKYFINGPSKVRALLLLQSPRECLGRMVRFITGHAFLRHHNAIVLQGINPPLGDNSCRLCEDSIMDETPHHIITECDRLCNWRATTLGAYVLEEFPEWDPKSLNKFLSRKEIILLETDDE